MGRDWTFLSNHGLVILAIATDPTATQRAIGDAVGITERAAQRLIADLVEGGYVRRIAEGRRNRYEIIGEAPLRHALSRESALRTLLTLIDPADPADR